jgi:hypothetical protein
MAQDNRFDPARLERIERRLRVLEDAEAIRNLKARYADLCDNQYDADGIAKLFRFSNWKLRLSAPASFKRPLPSTRDFSMPRQ